MVDIAISRTEFGPDTDQGFIVKPQDITEVGCTLNLALFGLTAEDRSIPAGTPLGKVTASGLYGPYSGGANRTDESVTLTEGGSGLTSWTATFGGQTTSSLDDDATAGQVEAALEALSTIGEGNVEVTGGPLGTGPFTVTFTGDLADADVGAITTTPTGGTGTVVVAVVTTGGAEGSADGRQTFAGLLFDTIPTRGKTSGNVGASRIVLGAIYEAKLPTPIDSAAKADMTTLAFV
jgi:hypothetical protein